MDDLYNSYSSGANTDFVMNAVSLLVGRGDSISIRSKSLDYNYLTISTAQSAFIKVCLIGIIPLLVLLYGNALTIQRSGWTYAGRNQSFPSESVYRKGQSDG